MHSYSLTNARVMRDGERAARRHESRSCAAHAVHPLRRSGLTGGAMVRRAYRQRSLIEVLLPDADKLWDPTLRRIDALLDDEGLVDRAARPWPGAIPRASAEAAWAPRWPSCCGCSSSSTCTTGALTSVSGKYAGAWSARLRPGAPVLAEPYRQGQ